MKAVKVTGTCEFCGHDCETHIINRIENVKEFIGNFEFRCCQCHRRIRDCELEEVDL